MKTPDPNPAFFFFHSFVTATQVGAPHFAKSEHKANLKIAQPPDSDTLPHSRFRALRNKQKTLALFTLAKTPGGIPLKSPENRRAAPTKQAASSRVGAQPAAPHVRTIAGS